MFGNTLPYEDTFRIHDEFDTEVMDFDVETQPLGFDDETQIMELSGETQVMEDDEDDCVQHMDTQLLDISDGEGCEYTSDMKSSPMGSIDVELQGRNGNQTSVFEEKETPNCHQQDGGAMHSDDVAQSSGPVRKGFASVRTASLRAAGLAARQAAVKNIDSGTSELHPFDDNDRKSIAEIVGGENDIEKYGKEGLSDGDKSNVARSLARKLFMDEDVAEIESDDYFSDRREGSSQFPSSDNDVAGLSYVDSQEPGELSQANALEFVDRFLNVNEFKSDECVKRKNAVAEFVSPGAIAKGAQSIAQQATRKSTHAETSVYEWDDNLEDEGGGDFFIKKKEVLYGTPKSHPKLRSFQHRELRGHQSLGKLQNVKKKQNLNDSNTGSFRSDLKSINGGGNCKIKDVDLEKKKYNCSSGQLGLGSCSQETLATVHNAQSVDMHNVGIDTQMAAEAMEALAAVTAFVDSDIGMADKGCHSERDQNKKEAVKNDISNQWSSLQKRARLSAAGVVTRSRSKRTIRTRGQPTMAKFDVGLINTKAKQKRSSINNFSAENRRKSSEIGPLSVNESLERITAADCSKVDGPSCRTGDIQCTSSLDHRSGEKRYTWSADRALEINMESIARRTRARSSTTQCAEISQDEEGLFSCRITSEDDRQLSSKKQNAASPPAKGTLGSATMHGSPGNLQKSSNQADTTPINLRTPASAVSPICMGDGYHTPSCKKSLSLKKEFNSLIDNEQRGSSPFKGLRRRRDMNSVRVLFSRHLDDDTIRQQKKILSRFGVSVASSILEATHFVADMFARTRNMLEAIAYAKPVVTHLWLESCGQSNCFIDEKNYILRDAKKEKELGFSMPGSLARASRYPLLEGKRVLITPNAKPGKEVILSLVKAVHGQAVERMGRSVSNIDDLLVISCEEDFEVCVPLLEKGIAIYSSELLLNGIITQRLEYERYRLFVAHVKKTRTTLWLKKGGEQFLRVTKTK
ncbi:hypothetical protein SOVF_154950 [Spinacia oleracea]|nr:hypothetical protein SOVF_154950 [Spinacia oleracea]